MHKKERIPTRGSPIFSPTQKRVLDTNSIFYCIEQGKLVLCSLEEWDIYLTKTLNNNEIYITQSLDFTP